MPNLLTAEFSERGFCVFNSKERPMTTVVNFKIDGHAVSELFPTYPMVGVTRSLIHSNSDWYLTGAGSINPHLTRNQIPLLVCDECGELGCGAIYTRIHVGRRTVFWSSFGFSYGIGMNPVLKPGLFAFDRSRYSDLILSLAESPD